MAWLLDTNTVIFYLKGNPAVVSRWKTVAPSEVRMSAVTLYELLVGAETSRQPERRRGEVAVLRSHIEVLPFGTGEAAHAARIAAALRAQGRMIDAPDLLIAATALSHDLVVVTNHADVFSRIPGLRVEDWTA